MGPTSAGVLQRLCTLDLPHYAVCAGTRRCVCARSRQRTRSPRLFTRTMLASTDTQSATMCRYSSSGARVESSPISAAKSSCRRPGRIDCPVWLSTSRYGHFGLRVSMTSGDRHHQDGHEFAPLCEIGEQRPTCGVKFCSKVGCLLEVGGRWGSRQRHVGTVTRFSDGRTIESPTFCCQSATARQK